jgi:hypothetical protein
VHWPQLPSGAADPVRQGRTIERDALVGGPGSKEYGLTLPFTFDAYMVEAIKELHLNLATIASSTASSTPDSQSFAASIFHNLFARITAWLADATNGITDLFAKNLYASNITADTGTFHQVAADELCARDGPGDQNPVCVTKTQLAALLGAAASGGNTGSVISSGTGNLTNSGNPDNANSSSAADPSSTPPIIQINGENPAHVPVGATYQDLGATIVAPDADKNLGIKTFLNGTLVSDIVIDTSAAATDTIDYVATDPTGLTATSTRMVMIDLAPLPPSSVVPSTPDAIASSTALVPATSTMQ